MLRDIAAVVVVSSILSKQRVQDLLTPEEQHREQLLACQKRKPLACMPHVHVETARVTEADFWVGYQLSGHLYTLVEGSRLVLHLRGRDLQPRKGGEFPGVCQRKVWLHGVVRLDDPCFLNTLVHSTTAAIRRREHIRHLCCMLESEGI